MWLPRRSKTASIIASSRVIIITTMSTLIAVVAVGVGVIVLSSISRVSISIDSNTMIIIVLSCSMRIFMTSI